MRFIDQNHILSPVFSHQEGLPISKYKSIPRNPINEEFIFSPELQQYLSGKELIHSEIHFSVEQLHTHYQHGFIALNHGIYREKDHLTCNRCGNNNPSLFAHFSCARCGEQQCHYCRKCIMMGRVCFVGPVQIGPWPMNHI